MSQKRYHFTLIGGGQFSTIGGIVRSISDIANALVERGHTVKILARGESGDTPFYTIDPRVEIEWMKYPFNPRRIPDFREKLKTLETDALGVFFSNRQGLNVMAAARNLHFPVLRSEHGNPYHLLEHIWNGNDAVRNLTFQFADKNHVLLDSFASKKPFTRYFKDSMTIIPSPISLDVPLANPAGKTDNRKRIIYAGRLEAFEKDTGALLDGFLRLSSEFPDWDCHFYGDGGLRSDLEKRVKRNGTDQVFFHGAVDIDILSQAFAQSHLFVIPSETEGCPMSLGEAMAHGLPAIGFRRCGGVNEMIQHGVTGFLVEKKLRKRGINLVEPMRILMQDADKRAEFGRAGREAIAPFESELVFNAWEKLFIKTAKLKPKLETVRANRKKRYVEFDQVDYLYESTIKEIIHSKEVPPPEMNPFAVTPDQPVTLKSGLVRPEVIVDDVPVIDPVLLKNIRPKVSIIIPAYNMEDFIGETIDLAKTQSLPDVEIIVINDGSSDGTQQAAMAAAKGDRRIRVFKTPNKGVSAARNYGLEKSTGDFVIFWDGDDRLSKEGIEKLYKAAVLNGADITVGYLYLFDNRTGKKWLTPKYWYLKAFSEARTHIRDNHILRYDVSASNKLYNRDFLLNNNLKFPTDVRLEDIYLSLHAHITAQCVTIVPVNIGGYRKFFTAVRNKNTGSQTWGDEKINSVIRVYVLLHEMLLDLPVEQQADLRKDIDIYFLSVFHFALTVVMQEVENPKKAAQWREDFHQVLRGIDDSLLSLLPLEKAYLLFGIKSDPFYSMPSDIANKPDLRISINQPDIRAMSLPRLIKIFDNYSYWKRIPIEASNLNVVEYFAKQSMWHTR